MRVQHVPRQRPRGKTRLSGPEGQNKGIRQNQTKLNARPASSIFLISYRGVDHRGVDYRGVDHRGVFADQSDAMN